MAHYKRLGSLVLHSDTRSGKLRGTKASDMRERERENVGKSDIERIRERERELERAFESHKDGGRHERRADEHKTSCGKGDWLNLARVRRVPVVSVFVA